MNRTHFGIGVGREKPKKLMLALDRILLGAARAVPYGPDACKDRKRAVVTECEPGRRLAWLGIRIFAKGCEGDQAAVGGFQPGSPVRALDVADVGYWCPK